MSALTPLVQLVFQNDYNILLTGYLAWSLSACGLDRPHHCQSSGEQLIRSFLCLKLSNSWYFSLVLPLQNVVSSIIWPLSCVSYFSYHRGAAVALFDVFAPPLPWFPLQKSHPLPLDISSDVSYGNTFLVKWVLPYYTLDISITGLSTGELLNKTIFYYPYSFLLQINQNKENI